MTTKKVAISFRKSEAIEIADESAFVEWAQTHNRDDLLTYKAPTVNKTAVKAALASGETIDGARSAQRQNIQIK